MAWSYMPLPRLLCSPSLAVTGVVEQEGWA